MIYPARYVPFQTNGWILKKSELNTRQAINFQAPIFSKTTRAGELLLELKALRVMWDTYLVRAVNRQPLFTARDDS